MNNLLKKKNRWKKVLYIDHGVPDNYTDESFLDEMKKNVDTTMYDLKSVIYESGIVSQQVSTISIYVSIFYYMDAETVHPTTLIVIMILIVLSGILFQRMLSHTQIDIGAFMRVSIFVFALSPVLKTLTQTISTDTIYAMATCMLCANLLFHDYGAGAAIVSKAISLNASIFSAVCLGSRLQSSWHVYVFIMLAIVLFAHFPEFRKNVKKWHRKLYIVLTESLVISATLLLIPISLLSAFALVAAHVAITFLFPIWMVRLQQLKNNIHGPWDEAMIKR